MTTFRTRPSFLTMPSTTSMRAVPRAVLIAVAASAPLPVRSILPDRRPVTTPGVPANAVAAATSTFDNAAFQRNAGVRPATFADSVPSYLPSNRPKDTGSTTMESGVSRARPASLSRVRPPIEAFGASSVTAMFIARPAGWVTRSGRWRRLHARHRPRSRSRKASNSSRFSAPALMVSSPAGAGQIGDPAGRRDRRVGR